MSRTKFHDVIIVGSEAAGLMAAGLLRRMDYRVLVIGQGQPGSHYHDHGKRVPALPVALPPFGQGPMLDRVLEDMGVQDSIHRLGTPDDTCLQVVTPDQRIDLFPERSLLKSELNRTFPGHTGAFFKIVDKLEQLDDRFKNILAEKHLLPPKKMRERARVKRLSASLEAGDIPPENKWPPLLKILAAATGFLSRLDAPMRPIHVTGHLLLSLLGGLRTVPDFSELLMGAIRKTGGDVEEKTVAEEILIERKLATGVRTLRSAKTCNGSLVVASLPIEQTLQLVPLGHRHKQFLATANSVRQVKSLFSMNLIVPDNSLPVGMGNQVLLVRKMEDPLQEDNLIRIHRFEQPERKDRSLINLSCLVPYRQRSLGREYLGPLQKRVIAAASWLIPFLSEHLEGQSSPFWESRAEDEPHPAPWSLHSIIETGQPLALGCAVLPSRTPYKNLFYCGPEAIPGLGLEGAAYAANQIVRLVTEEKKLKKIL